MKLSFLSLVFVAFASAGGPGQAPSDRPLGHGYHAMAYDSSSQKIVLFGGQTGDIFSHPETCLSSDTWAYDPARNEWRRLNPAERPPGLTAHAMAYDGRANKAVLYGGLIMTDAKEPRLIRQTWAFDYPKKKWKRMADGPPERYGHRLVYAGKAGLIVLFGGARVDAATKNNAHKLGDVWVYDARADQWEEMRPLVGPSPRHYFGMVYDSKADRVIVWGGAREGSPDASSVWVYDLASNAWTERKPAAGPEPLSYVAMAYDARADKTVIYGGDPEGRDETWLYDYGTNSWARRFPKPNPGLLSRMPIVYVPEIGRTVLFGGQRDKRQFVYSDEIWLYDGESNAWENVTKRQGESLAKEP